MKYKYVKSLLFLSRWHNGRAERLAAQYQAHLATLNELLASELGGRVYQYKVELKLCGIPLIASLTPQGVELHSIGKPSGFGVDQRKHELVSKAIASVVHSSEPAPEVGLSSLGISAS